MLHATFTSGFFDFGNTYLDNGACELMLRKLDDPVCARFLGSREVGAEFSETTAAHIVRCYENLERHVKTVLPPSPFRTRYLGRSKAMLAVHDTSDILREVIIARTETDPAMASVINDAVLRYDLTLTPFVYQLALLAHATKTPALFNDTIDYMRDACVTKDTQMRGLAPDEAVEFCGNAITMVADQRQKMQRFAKWDCPEHQWKIGQMMDMYQEIEQTLSFAGLQSKIHEKCDGTDYSVSVTEQKIASGLDSPTLYSTPPHIQNRINGRYESLLHELFRGAGKNPELVALAVGTMNYCYGVSEKTMQYGREYFSTTPLAGEPDGHTPLDLQKEFSKRQIQEYLRGPSGTVMPSRMVAELYHEARRSALESGVVLLPHPKQTLAASDDARPQPLAPEVTGLLHRADAQQKQQARARKPALRQA